MGVLIITHYQRILHLVQPSHVHVIYRGRIVRQGGPELVEDLDLYIYRLDGDELKVVEKDWRTIRDMIVTGMNNFGHPYIVVEDGDYRRNRELYLKHVYEDQEIDIEYAEKALRHVYQLWKRPVHLETILNGKTMVLTFDGDKNAKRIL